MARGAERRGDGDGADAGERAPDAVQEALPFDEPVPYRLTTAGRRLVAPDEQPSLQVVSGSGGAGSGRSTELEGLDGATRARARALRRGGLHTLDIAERLDADPLHVEQWVADLPVPAGGTPRRRGLTPVSDPGRGDDPAPGDRIRAEIVAAWQAARDAGRAEADRRLASDPRLRSGLGLAAGLLEPDQHALLLSGEDHDLVAAAWRWVVTTLELGADVPVRVLVRHDPAAAADRVGRAVAGVLEVPLAAVTTTRDPRRTGREPAVRLRVADPAIAGRVAGWRAALVADVTAPHSSDDVGA